MIHRLAVFTAFALAALAAASSAEAINLKKIAKDLKAKSAPKESAATTAQAAPASAGAMPGSALVCNSAKQMGLCYAFTGQKHLDEHAAGKERLAKNPPKNGKQGIVSGNDMACKMMKGQLAENSQCPTQNAVGTCRIKQGQPDEYTLVYYNTGRMPASKAESDCSNPKSSVHIHGAGTWSKL